MTNPVDGINSANNIANSLSSLDFLDQNKATRNDVETLGDNIQKLSTSVGAMIPGAGPVVAALGAFIGIVAACLDKVIGETCASALNP